LVFSIGLSVPIFCMQSPEEAEAGKALMDALDEKTLPLAVLQQKIEAKPALVMTKDDRGETLLMYAARVGLFDIVNYLLSQEYFKNNIDEKNKRGQTALDFAANFDITKLLITKGALVGTRANKLLRTAVLTGNVDNVHYVLNLKELKDNPAIGTAFDEGFFLAAMSNHVAIMKVLLARGADPTMISFLSGLTPLMAAAGEGSLQALEYLLTLDGVKKAIDQTANEQRIDRDTGKPILANIDSYMRRYGCTALFFAVDANNQEAVNLLLGAGALVEVLIQDDDVYKGTKDTITLLEYARKKAKSDATFGPVVKMLEDFESHSMGKLTHALAMLKAKLMTLGAQLRVIVPKRVR